MCAKIDFENSNNCKDINDMATDLRYIVDHSISQENFSLAMDNLKLTWIGEIESLKLFTGSFIDKNGRWNSPGDERKKFACSGGKTTLMWWKRKKYLKVEGPEALSIMNKLCLFLNGKMPSPNTTSTRSLPNIQSACPCRCGEVRADVEGLELNVPILESKYNKESEVSSKSILKLHDEITELRNEQASLRKRVEVTTDTNRELCRKNTNQHESRAIALQNSNSNPVHGELSVTATGEIKEVIECDLTAECDLTSDPAESVIDSINDNIQEAINDDDSVIIIAQQLSNNKVQISQERIGHNNQTIKHSQKILDNIQPDEQNNTQWIANQNKIPERKLVTSPTQIPVISQNKEIVILNNAYNHQCMTSDIQRTKSNVKSVPNNYLAQFKESKIAPMSIKPSKSYITQMPVKRDIRVKQSTKPLHTRCRKSKCKSSVHNWVGSLPLIHLPTPPKQTANSCTDGKMTTSKQNKHTLPSHSNHSQSEDHPPFFQRRFLNRLPLI